MYIFLRVHGVWRKAHGAESLVVLHLQVKGLVPPWPAFFRKNPARIRVKRASYMPGRLKSACMINEHQKCRRTNFILLIFISFFMTANPRSVISAATWAIKGTLQEIKIRNDFHTYVNRMPQIKR